MIDWSVNIGQLASAAVTIFSVGVVYARLTDGLARVSQSVEKLAALPETVARHDERLKTLEK